MIVLRFGKAGRLAKICDTAIQIAHPDAVVYTANRAGEFVADRAPIGLAKYACVETLLQRHPAAKVVLLDASVDHSSTANLVAHEKFKRNIISSLHSANVLEKAVGFSSGITMMNTTRIHASAQHMLEYRGQKLAQETLFNTLACPVFIPNIFTLVGPITYATQSAAWAQILKARLLRSSGVVLNEPEAKKAWTSEFRVFRSVLDFLAAPAPLSTKGPLVNGEFTLSEIGKGAYLNLTELAYNTSNISGWLEGDYVPESYATDHQSVYDELIRSLYQ